MEADELVGGGGSLFLEHFGGDPPYVLVFVLKPANERCHGAIG